MTLSTPGGRPASSAASPSTVASSGVNGLGRSTTVHPVTSAGTTFHRFVVNGKFDGVIAATTPTGSYRRIDTFTLLPAMYSEQRQLVVLPLGEPAREPDEVA